VYVCGCDVCMGVVWCVCVCDVCVGVVCVCVKGGQA